MLRRCLQVTLLVTVIAATILFTATEAEAAGDCVTQVPYRFADALDNRGHVGGYGERMRAYMWDSRGGTTRWLGGIEGGLPSNVTDISPDGNWLVGWADVASSFGGIRHNGWRRGPDDDRLVPVPTPPGFASELRYVTSSGLAAGDFTDLASGWQRPFIWSADGQLINLLWPQPFQTGTVMDLDEDDGALLVSAKASTTRTLEWKAPYANYPTYPSPTPPARFGQSSDTIVGSAPGGGVMIVRTGSTTPPTYLRGPAALGVVGDADQAEGRVTGGGINGAWTWHPGQAEVLYITTRPVSGVRVGRRINREGDVLVERGPRDFIVWVRPECLP